jgi:DNA-binding phage protein
MEDISPETARGSGKAEKLCVVMVRRGGESSWRRKMGNNHPQPGREPSARLHPQTLAGNAVSSRGTERNPNSLAIREAAKAEAVTRVVAWQLTQEMERQGMTKAALAEKMHTSRAQVDRILKAKGNITIETLQRAAALVGRELRLELV